MIKKSNCSFETAKMIINKRDENYLTASVHCMYFSVLQKMKYVLSKTDNNPISLDDQKAQSSQEGEGSHKYILENIKNRIKNIHHARTFTEKFRILQAQRVDADYSEKQFTLDECLKIKSNTEGILANLNQYFGSL